MRQMSVVKKRKGRSSYPGGRFANVITTKDSRSSFHLHRGAFHGQQCGSLHNGRRGRSTRAQSINAFPVCIVVPPNCVSSLFFLSLCARLHLRLGPLHSFQPTLFPNACRSCKLFYLSKPKLLSHPQCSTSSPLPPSSLLSLARFWVTVS